MFFLLVFLLCGFHLYVYLYMLSEYFSQSLCDASVMRMCFGDGNLGRHGNAQIDGDVVSDLPCLQL